MLSSSIARRMLSRSLLLAGALVAGLAAADEAFSSDSPIRVETQLASGAIPRLASPLRVGHRLRFPIWTEDGLWRSPPSTHPGLERVNRPGASCYDPSTRAWYASAQGALFRIEGDGRLTVVADNVQGLDIDVRAALKRAVSREPNDTIVLHDWSTATPSRKVLMSGQAYFGPRFSPDGTRILLRESRAGGGHMWSVSIDGTATDLGMGNDPVWHPDGKHIVFVRMTHDGLTLTASDLWAMDTLAHTEECLASTGGMVEVQPAISPDGRWVAFADGRTGEGYVAELSFSRAGR